MMSESRSEARIERPGGYGNYDSLWVIWWTLAPWGYPLLSAKNGTGSFGSSIPAIFWKKESQKACLLDSEDRPDRAINCTRQ